jgi:hypothetical protein
MFCPTFRKLPLSGSSSRRSISRFGERTMRQFAAALNARGIDLKLVRN